MGNICHHVTSFHCVLTPTYVCYRCVLYVAWEWSLWISQVHWSIVCRNQHNFPCHQGEWGFVHTPLLIQWPDNLWSLYDIFAKKTTDHFTSNLGTNTIEHSFEMKMYLILPTCRKFFTLHSDNFYHKISVGEITLVHVFPSGQAFRTLNKYLIILLCRTGVSCRT